MIRNLIKGRCLIAELGKIVHLPERVAGTTFSAAEAAGKTLIEKVFQQLNTPVVIHQEGPPLGEAYPIGHEEEHEEEPNDKPQAVTPYLDDRLSS